MIAQQSFPNQLPSVTKARRFVEEALAGLPEELVESAKLIVSELATNSLRHAHTAFEVDVDVDEQRVRIAVTDDGSGEPQVRSPEPTDTSGRGLRIVDALSNEWGVFPAAGPRGKTVWFRLSVNDRSMHGRQ